ncbi:hypothetical protein [Treponema sp.]|uniref:hypothetical protein n=1 Tax=Treponema sp. TaxID=166 RepID=UPI00388D9CA7
MKKQLMFSVIVSFLFSLAIGNSLFSCSGKTKSEPENTQETLITTHSWYYLKKDGFEKINSPLSAPLVIKKPWTESIRISAIGQTALIDTESKSEAPEIFALVNRVGLIKFDSDKMSLVSDSLLFKDVTAEQIVFMNGRPVFSLYKNDFFNESLSNVNEKNISVLVQFDTESNSFFPIINSDTLQLEKTAQINDFFWDGTYWYYCIKNSLKDKTIFSYIKWKPQSSLLSILPANSKEKITVRDSDETEFRNKKTVQPFASAPERVKKLLSTIPSNFNFSIEVKTAGGPSPRYYENISSEGDSPVEAKVQLSDSWTAAVFKDGTMYFTGSLFNRRMLNNSKPVALRLPRLPEGFIYTDFGISGGTLYVSWEEVSFYETGRSGFLSVDLAKVLYNEL